MTARRVRILSVDDHAFLAEGLKTRFTLERDMEFVGWIGSADALLAEVEPEQGGGSATGHHAWPASSDRLAALMPRLRMAAS